MRRTMLLSVGMIVVGLVFVVGCSLMEAPVAPVGYGQAGLDVEAPIAPPPSLRGPMGRYF